MFFYFLFWNKKGSEGVVREASGKQTKQENFFFHLLVRYLSPITKNFPSLPESQHIFVLDLCRCYSQLIYCRSAFKKYVNMRLQPLLRFLSACVHILLLLLCIMAWKKDKDKKLKQPKKYTALCLFFSCCHACTLLRLSFNPPYSFFLDCTLWREVHSNMCLYISLW